MCIENGPQYKILWNKNKIVYLHFLYNIDIYMQNNMTKKELRIAIRTKKRELGAEELKRMSANAAALIEQDNDYINSKIIMVYHPLWDEVDVTGIYEKAFAAGKRVILPTVKGDDIIPVEITPNTKWVKGDFDIMEPVAEPYQGTFDTIIVPGVAFDREGNRLGRGKGYYDRFLPNHEQAIRIGICFEFQLVDNIPAEPFDYKMNHLIVVK